ncbi:unnamed protein product [Nippostrongylus brasiliensis]|uniref:BTB domain-containing protein n=1 Tax=Nippostrongylus brasiliensis TaxID=27835 RepID=A0A0N4YSU9_NIPBR|nr:hypothetical protein Q1695_004503 [Nippostrongylus brasiliensis]VDL84059.1 unnamed protein product [Nippostrongylus brasiliensis]
MLPCIISNHILAMAFTPNHITVEVQSDTVHKFTSTGLLELLEMEFVGVELAVECEEVKFRSVEKTTRCSTLLVMEYIRTRAPHPEMMISL